MVDENKSSQLAPPENSSLTTRASRLPFYARTSNKNSIMDNNQKRKEEEKRASKAIVKNIGYLLVVLGILTFPIFFLLGLKGIGLLLLLIGLFLVFWGQFRRGKINKIISLVILISCILAINYFWFHIFELFTPLTNWMTKRGERIKNEAIEIQDSQKCSEIKALPLLPRTFSSFLFPTTESKISPLRQDCLFSIAIAEKNAALCKLIGAEEYKKEYKNYSGRAQSYYVDECIRKLALTLNDEFICESTGMTENGRSVCYWKVAVEKGDLSLCEKADYRASDRYECYAEIAIAKLDPSLCLKIDKKDLRIIGECYQKIAVIQEKPELCNEIPVIQYYSTREDCYFEITEIAVKKYDPDLCKPIADLYWRSRCYTEVAVVENNSELCQEIPDYSKYRNECLSIVKKGKGTLLVE